MKRILFFLIFTLSLLPFLLPSEKTIAHQFITKDKQESKTLQQWQNENPDILYLLEFNEDKIKHSIPVVYTPDNPTKYFRLSVYNEKDTLGTAFLDENCTPESQNRLINGHSSKTRNLQFSFLKNYTNLDYFQKHDTFTLEDSSGRTTYQIIAFCEFDMEQTPLYLGWFNDTFPTQKAVQNMFILIEPYTLQKQDFNYQNERILTLITCNMEKENSRYVLFAIESSKDLNQPGGFHE